MKIKLYIVVGLLLCFSFYSITVHANNHEIKGSYEYGEKITKKSYGGGCFGGCHSHKIDMFKGSSPEAVMERIETSWHIASLTEEDLRDLSVFLSIKANQWLIIEEGKSLGVVRFELTTFSMSPRHSTTELNAPDVEAYYDFLSF